MNPAAKEEFRTWYSALEDRHLADLTFQEVRRAVQALSVAYVESRPARVGRALESAGKRAAFALYYAPLHFLLVREIVLAGRIPLSGAGGASDCDTCVDSCCGVDGLGAARLFLRFCFDGGVDFASSLEHW